MPKKRRLSSVDAGRTFCKVLPANTNRLQRVAEEQYQVTVIQFVKRTPEKQELSHTLTTTPTTTETESAPQSGPLSSTVTGGAERSREMQYTNDYQRQSGAPTASTSAQTSYENQPTASGSGAAALPTQPELNWHILMEHDGAILTCRVCPDNIIDTDSYNNHMMSHGDFCGVC